MPAGGVVSAVEGLEQVVDGDPAVPARAGGRAAERGGAAARQRRGASGRGAQALADAVQSRPLHLKRKPDVLSSVHTDARIWSLTASPTIRSPAVAIRKTGVSATSAAGTLVLA